MKYLELKDINFKYDNKYILKNFNLNIKKGEILLIQGKSGIGKSTILRIISGLENLESGSIFLDNENITKKPIEKRKIAYLFQDYALFPHMTVYQNIAYGANENKKVIVKQMLDLIKMPGFENRYPHELSGGEKQRVALARSLANSPKLLLLDEPFSSLDENLKNDLRIDLKNILNSLNISSIIVSHDKNDAIIADNILLMEE